MRHIVVLPIDSGDPSNRYRLSPRAVRQQLGELVFLSADELLLPDVGRVADYGSQFRHRYRCVVGWHFAERLLF
jgi:hypothetical protein